MGGTLSIASDAVSTFRTEWDDRFVDACEIRDTLDDTDRGPINTTSYQYDEQTSGLVYTGACLVRPSMLADKPEVYGQEARTFTSADIYLPHDAAAVDLDQEVLITSSVTDPQLVGLTWVIRSIIRDSYNTRRQIKVELDLGTGISF